MQIVKKGKRKAISPVLATVILIAITLIAAIAIAGFVFGIFGTFTANAQISATSVSCVTGVANGVCTIILTNNGNSVASAQSCSFAGSGGGAGTLVLPLAGGSIAPGTTLSVTCTSTTGLGIAGTEGTALSGSVGLSNGGSALYAGTWQ